MAEELKASSFSSNDEFLERLGTGEEKAFQAIYEWYENEFVYWANQNFNLKEPKIYDAFQEAVSTIYLNIKQGKLTQLTCEFQTYLFAVAKNLLLKRQGIENRYELIEEIKQAGIDPGSITDDDEYDYVNEEAKIMVEKVGEPCKSILTRYYLDEQSMTSIAHEMGYKNADVAKAQKLRCLNYLKKLLKQ